MRVVIVRCSQEYYWYQEKIDKVFEVALDVYGVPMLLGYVGGLSYVVGQSEYFSGAGIALDDGLLLDDEDELYV